MLRIVKADSPELTRTAKELFLEYASGLGVSLCFQNFDRELATLPGDYAPPAGGLLLAFEDVQAAGCVALRPISDGTCEMKRLYVRPAFRGTGLGRRLATEIMRLGREIGYRTMRLDTLPSMRAAIDLYPSLGFRVIAPYRNDPIAGIIYMEVDLAAGGPLDADEPGGGDNRNPESGAKERHGH